jgi:hypothetical protein
MKYPKAITFVVLLLILSSCKKKCEEYYLGSLKNMNPYTGTEALIFNTTTGNEIVFNGQGRSTRMNTTGPNYSGDICESIEFDNCYFEEENGLFDFKIYLRPTTSNVQAHLDLIFKNYSYDSKSYIYEYQVNFEIPLDKNNLGADQIYYDSLLIYNTLQYNVFADTPSPYKSIPLKEVVIDTIIQPSLIYYNIHNGLIKVDFDDGSTWELKEIIP